MDTIKVGLNLLLVLLGASVFGVVMMYDTRWDAESAVVVAEAEAEQKASAREDCAEACEAHGMSVETVRTEGSRATSCSCADGPARLTIWNDLRSRQDSARAQCTEACLGVGATVSRAILGPDTEYDGHRGVTLNVQPVVLACSCNTPTSHRVLWDDR